MWCAFKKNCHLWLPIKKCASQRCGPRSFLRGRSLRSGFQPHPQLKCDECQWPPVTSSQSLEVSGTVSAAQRLLTQGSWEAAGPMQQTLKHNAVCVWPRVFPPVHVCCISCFKKTIQRKAALCVYTQGQTVPHLCSLWRWWLLLKLFCLF